MLLLLLNGLSKMGENWKTQLLLKGDILKTDSLTKENKYNVDRAIKATRDGISFLCN